MAFKQLTGISFIADSIEDLKKLPSKRGLGASCFVVEDGKEYKCNSKGEWKPYSPTIIIEGGNISGGGSNPDYYGGNDRAAQADWEQVDPNAPDYIRNRPFFDTTKVLSTQTLNITEPFTIITREELGWPEDFFNYSYAQSNEYAVYKDLDLLGNWQNETIIEYCWLEETTDENERVIRWIGDEWFENAKTFLMYYYDDEPETIYIKTNRKGQFAIKNIYKEYSTSFFASNPSITQNDWDVNYKNSPRYIRNKPFYHDWGVDSYSDMITLEPIENQGMIQTTLSLNDYHLQEIFNNPGYPFDYNSIKVIKTDLNGNKIEYICDIQNSFDFEEPPIDKYVKWIGDFPSIFGYDIDSIEHFCLYYLPDEDCNTLYFEGEAGTYEFYLYSPGEIKKIDEKFLPESRQKQADWDQINSEAPDYIKNKPIQVDQDVNYKIELDIFAENGNHQHFSRTDYNLEKFLLSNYGWYDIVLKKDDGDIIQSFNRLIQYSEIAYNPETDSEEIRISLSSNQGFMFYYWENTPDIIYYEGIRFGKFEIINLSYSTTFFPQPKYDILRKYFQSDWDQSNNTAFDYIKNRPFYEVDGINYYADIIDTSLGNQFSKNEYDLWGFLRPEANDNTFKIISQNDNKEYVFQMQYSYDWLGYAGANQNYNKYCVWYGDMPKELGDLTICGFSFYCYPDENPDIIYYEGPEDVYTINHYKEYELQKIDRKFIPTNLINWNEGNPNSESYIQNKPFYETNSYLTNYTIKTLKENQSFNRTEDLGWFLNPNNAVYNMIELIGAGVSETFEPTAIMLNEEQYIYYIGDKPSILDPENTQYGFSFYVDDIEPDVIYYEGPTDTWYFWWHHPSEFKQIDKKFIPTVQLNLPELIDTDSLEEPALTLANTLNSLITTLQGKYIIE